MVYMSKKKEKIDLNNLAPEEELKYEIAKELGLLDKVMEQGWKALTAKETGRIGGLMTSRRREEKKSGMKQRIKSDFAAMTKERKPYEVCCGGYKKRKI